MIIQEKVLEETTKWLGERPITFAEFLTLVGVAEDVELIDGVLVEKSMVQLDHEKLLHWLDRVLGPLVEERDLGIVLGSRTAVEISQFRGRLPDLLFVRRDRLGIVRQKAVYGPPDLVIEIISPGDRPSDVMGLETDYRAIGVPEIVFIDQRKRRVRTLRRQANDYQEEVTAVGKVALETLGGLALQIDWLFSEPRPGSRATIELLLAQIGSESPGG